MTSGNKFSWTFVLVLLVFPTRIDAIFGLKLKGTDDYG